MMVALLAYLVFRAAKRGTRRLEPPLSNWINALVPFVIAIIVVVAGPSVHLANDACDLRLTAQRSVVFAS